MNSLHAVLPKPAYLKRRRILMDRGAWRGRTPIVGTQRRLRALACLGWSWTSLAAEVGVSESVIRRLSRAQYSTVNAATADRVAALYERLSMTRGPSSRAATHAARNGFAPPLAWDDTDLDDPDATPRDGLEHGTRKGYDAHRLRGERACQACRDGAAAAGRRRRAA